MSAEQNGERQPAEQMPILEQRRIEATVIKPIYEEMVAELGIETAQRILGTAIKKAAVAQGQAFAAKSEAETGLESFADLLKHWTANGALEIDITERNADKFNFDVKRCRYAEMYKAMGLGDIGHLLSCNRDGTFCEGYDPRIKLDRSQTIMGGASHCDFRYTIDK